MLKWVPEERRTAKELLNDPWVNGDVDQSERVRDLFKISQLGDGPFKKQLRYEAHDIVRTRTQMQVGDREKVMDAQCKISIQSISNLDIKMVVVISFSAHSYTKMKG
jgi:hypothetical protein